MCPRSNSYCGTHRLSHPFFQNKKNRDFIDMSKRRKATRNILRLPPTPPTFKNRPPDIRHFAEQPFWKPRIFPPRAYESWVSWEPLRGLSFMRVQYEECDDSFKTKVCCFSHWPWLPAYVRVEGWWQRLFLLLLITVSPHLPPWGDFTSDFFYPLECIWCYLVILVIILGPCRTLSHKAQDGAAHWWTPSARIESCPGRDAF